MVPVPAIGADAAQRRRLRDWDDPVKLDEAELGRIRLVEMPSARRRHNLVVPLAVGARQSRLTALLIEAFAAEDYGATFMQNHVTRLRGYAVGLRGYAVFVRSQGVIGLRSYAAKSESGLLLKCRILVETVLGNRPLNRGHLRAIATI